MRTLISAAMVASAFGLALAGCPAADMGCDGCPCEADGSCEPGLGCRRGRCQDVACAPGELHGTGCPCAMDAECEPGLLCGASRRCEPRDGGLADAGGRVDGGGFDAGGVPPDGGPSLDAGPASCLAPSGERRFDLFDFGTLHTRRYPDEIPRFQRRTNAELEEYGCLTCIEGECCDEMAACPPGSLCAEFASCIENCAPGSSGTTGAFDRCAFECTVGRADPGAAAASALHALYACVEACNGPDCNLTSGSFAEICGGWRVYSRSDDICFDADWDCTGSGACNGGCRDRVNCQLACLGIGDATEVRNCAAACQTMHLRPPSGWGEGDLFATEVRNFVNALAGTTCGVYRCREQAVSTGPDYAGFCGTGCGGSPPCSGTCNPFDACTACVSTGACPDGLECGIDGCGEECGGCASATDRCLDGACVPCVPRCSGRECGSDGCGGTCGTCSASETCHTGTGRCSCVPSCAGRTCGSDGCGGSCGSCGSGTTCSGGSCEPIPPDGLGANDCLGIRFRYDDTYDSCDTSGTIYGWFRNNCTRSIECDVCPATPDGRYNEYECSQFDLTPGDEDGGPYGGGYWCGYPSSYEGYWRWQCRFT